MKNSVKINGQIKSYNKTILIEGDKSLSIRWALLSSQALGKSKAYNLLKSEDVVNTLKCLKKLGVKIKLFKNHCEITGLGLNGFKYKENLTLDAGNSGTTSRLMFGAVATNPINTTFTGDKSLSSRPMSRVTNFLEDIGVKINLTKNKTTLVIAHRLSTIIRANKIIVLDQGKIVDSGTHAELLGKSNIYKNLYNKQLRSN